MRLAGEAAARDGLQRARGKQEKLAAKDRDPGGRAKGAQQVIDGDSEDDFVAVEVDAASSRHARGQSGMSASTSGRVRLLSCTLDWRLESLHFRRLYQPLAVHLKAVAGEGRFLACVASMGFSTFCSGLRLFLWLPLDIASF